MPNDIDTPEPLGSRRAARIIAKSKARNDGLAAKRKLALGYIASPGLDLPTGHQERTVREFASANGFDLLAVHVEAASAIRDKPALRSGFSSVLQAAEGGRFGTLIVYRASCLSSDAFDATLAAIDLLYRFGVVVRSAVEPDVDTSSPAGRMAVGMLAACAKIG